MDKTEIECEIVSKLEKIEKNKNIISEVLTENANASGSMNMPGLSQKKVVEIMNESDFNQFFSKYMSSVDMLKSEEMCKALKIKATEMDESFERTEETHNHFVDESTKPILVIEYHNSEVDT